MSRPLRLEYPGAVYHVTSRGNGRAGIFLDDQDRESFLSILCSVVKRYTSRVTHIASWTTTTTCCRQPLTPTFLQACDSSTAYTPRRTTLLHDLAQRRNEIISLDIDDVDLENKTVRILGKGNSQKEILSLPKQTSEALSRWIQVRGNFVGALFVNFHRSDKISGTRLSSTSLYRMVRELGKKTNQTVRPHGLRHTSISEAVAKAQTVGMDVMKVLHFSRHKDLKTLQVYIDQVENAQGKIAELVAR